MTAGEDRVTLVGVDVGTTTLRGLRVSARRVANAATGTSELVAARPEERLPVRLTPYRGAALDVGAIGEVVGEWIAGGPAPDGGGVLLTGLAARAPGAREVAEDLRSRVGGGAVLAASDPRLEAWVAFTAHARGLSRAHPERAVVNLDVGGGTTNVAWGRDGEVTRTASLFIGARHVRLEPGTRRIAAVSPEARALLAGLDLSAGQGETLADAAAAALVGRQVAALRALITTGEVAAADRALVEAAPEGARPGGEAPLVTVSGGVGELMVQGGSFDDLGPELARALAAEPWVTAPARDAGMATVCGLTLHATQLSGSSVFVARPDLLPCRDLPIVARLAASAGPAAWDTALGLARSAAAGGAVVVQEISGRAEPVRGAGLALAERLAGWPADRVLVLLVRDNVGLALGLYATAWGRRPAPLIVLDQVAIPGARLVTLGRPTRGQIPVAFSGLRAGDA